MAPEVAARYQAMGLAGQAQARAFISDMAGAYGQADLAISRAGALTLAELVAAKLPALLVPLPSAAGDHQTANARSLEKLGLARLVPESEIEGGGLEKIAIDLIGNPAILAAMSQKAEARAREAASVGPKMASLCLEALEASKNPKPAGSGQT